MIFIPADSAALRLRLRQGWRSKLGLNTRTMYCKCIRSNPGDLVYELPSSSRHIHRRATRHDVEPQIHQRKSGIAKENEWASINEGDGIISTIAIRLSVEC